MAETLNGITRQELGIDTDPIHVGESLIMLMRILAAETPSTELPQQVEEPVKLSNELPSGFTGTQTIETANIPSPTPLDVPRFVRPADDQATRAP